MKTYMKGDVSKWRAISKKLKYWDTEKARKIQELESRKIIQWLLELELSKYHILEIGCGNGYLGYLIISALRKHKIPFSYQFTDLLSECLDKAKVNLKELSTLPEIIFNKLDVFSIDKSLGAESQEIIISTGFSSAATYKDAVPKVAKVLKPKGILICDFVNNLSLPIFLKGWQRSIQRMRLVGTNAQDSDSKYYHFGKRGIKEYFELYNLELIKLISIGWMKNPLLAMFRKH